MADAERQEEAAKAEVQALERNFKKELVDHRSVEGVEEFMGFIGFIGLMRCPVGCRVCRVCRAFKGCRVGRVEGKTEVQTLECKCEKELVDHRSARGCIWGV